MRVTEVLEEKPKIEEGLLTPRIPFGMTSLFFEEQGGVRGFEEELKIEERRRIPRSEDFAWNDGGSFDGEGQLSW